MIYTERVISVKNGTATIDAPIVLFRGDRNIEIVFEIVNSKFKFSEKGNYILDIGAKYGQLAVDMPDGTDLFTDIAECLDGKVIFKITGDMINEIAENGFYSFHVRLFNDDKTSRVTIPPIMEGIEIREPIVIEGDAIFPIVDMGGVDIAPIDSDEETFIDENGKLDIQWVTGDIISSTRLNQMVDYINENTYSRDEFDLSSYVNKDYLDTKIEYMDEEMIRFDAELANTKYLFETINGDVNEIKYSYVTEDYVNNKNNDVINKIGTVETELDILQANLDNTIYNLNEHVDIKDTELSQRIDTLGESVEQNKKDIASLDSRVKNIETTISDVALDALREDLEGLRNTHDQDLSDIESDITNLQNEIGEIQNNHYTKEYIDEQFNEQNQRISDLENIYINPDGPDLSDYATKTYVEERIGECQEAIDDHDTRIEALENSQTNPEAPDLSNYATIEYVDGKITDIRGTLSDHITYITDNMVNINELDDRITALENLEGGSAIGVGKDYVDQKDNEIRVILGDHYAEIEDNQQDIIELENKIGDINAILDAINGEEI